MEPDDRERLRERLNFPRPVDRPPAPARSTTPAPEPEPVPEPAPEAPPSRDDQLAPLLERLSDQLTALDQRVAANADELARLHARFDAIELLAPGGEEQVGLEAVRRTVAASHRAITVQLRAMLDETEARLRDERRAAPFFDEAPQFQ